MEPSPGHERQGRRLRGCRLKSQRGDLSDEVQSHWCGRIYVAAALILGGRTKTATAAAWGSRRGRVVLGVLGAWCLELVKLAGWARAGRGKRQLEKSQRRLGMGIAAMRFECRSAGEERQHYF